MNLFECPRLIDVTKQRKQAPTRSAPVPVQMIKERLLTASETAEILQVDISTLNKWCSAKRIGFVNLNKRVGGKRCLRFEKTAIEQFIRQCQTDSRPLI